MLEWKLLVTCCKNTLCIYKVCVCGIDVLSIIACSSKKNYHSNKPSHNDFYETGHKVHESTLNKW